MNLDLIKGYVLVIFSGLALLAAGLLIILQWGNHTALTMYGPVVKTNTAVLMIASALGGVAIIYLAKTMIRGLHDMRKGLRTGELKRARNRIAQLGRQDCDQQTH